MNKRELHTPRTIGTTSDGAQIELVYFEEEGQILKKVFVKDRCSLEEMRTQDVYNFLFNHPQHGQIGFTENQSLIKEFCEYYYCSFLYGYFFIATKGCQHEWKPYLGFTDAYTYCTKCDQKLL